MASSSSSSAASSSSVSLQYTPYWVHAAFLCFREEEDDDFVNFIFNKVLPDNNITNYKKTEKTQSIDDLLSILQGCALSIVIFSQNFADSTKCLDEVAAIAQSKAQIGNWVLPIFYKMDRSDVTEESGRHDKKRWMAALEVVANCLVPTSDQIKNDYQLLQAVVGDVRKKLLDMSHSVECNNLVDMDSRISEVEQLLAMDTVADEFGIIGLWGMGGSGKTTLADACYKKHFNSSRKQEKIKHHFLENINNKCQGRQLGLQGLILELYSELLSDPKLNRQSLAAVNTREHLYNIRVFLVLDDVGSLWQLDELLLGYISTKCTKLFGPGSRIIVTTRDKQVIELGLLGKIYHVKCLNDDTSLQLFTLSAFKQAHPPDDFKDLSLEASRYCNGHPLALKVLGGIFSNNRDKKYWGNILYNLSHREGLARVDNILSESLKELGSRQKGVFLNVACFLCGMLRTRLIHFMKADGYDPYSDIKDLIGKSLLNCVSSKEGEVIEVHDLLRDMAWKNVKEEEPHLKKRSRLENPKDICKLLQVLKVATEGISLNLSKAKEDVILKGDAFVGMDSLKWLEFYGPIEGHKVHIESGVIDFLPTELRGLKWDLFPLQYLPAGFYPENLRILTLRNSNVDKCWEGECQVYIHNDIIKSKFNLMTIMS
ncbi:Putative disease resistance protein At4g11170 [Linum perenne]